MGINAKEKLNKKLSIAMSYHQVLKRGTKNIKVNFDFQGKWTHDSLLNDLFRLFESTMI